MTNQQIEPHPNSFRAQIYTVIFKTDTKWGKVFDIILLWAILGSVAAVLLESVAHIGLKYSQLLHYLEWTFTILFTIEYILRCYSVKKPSRYIKSFFGVIDFFAVIPTYLSLILVGAQSLIVIRALRLLRVFRILKLGRYLSEFEILIKALRSSWDKIIVFLSLVVTSTIIAGTVMYLIEGGNNGFTSIPKSIYWAIVTMTTVGYGDIAPHTILGQIVASIIMIFGYAIIVVPMGIFSVELTSATKSSKGSIKCPACGANDHLRAPIYCCHCGEKLP